MEALRNLVDDMCRRYSEEDQAAGNKPFDFLEAVEKDLENINATGVVKFTFFDGDHVSVGGENHRNEQSKSSTMASVKLERVSESSYESSLDMPPPQLPVKRAKKIKVKTEPMRHTRSKTAAKAKHPENETKERDSDLVLTKEHVSVIMLDDSDDENMSNIANVKEPLRHIKEEKLSICLPKPEDYSNKNRVTRSTKVLTKRASSIYEDCVSMPQVQPGTDATFIYPPPQNSNTTFVAGNAVRQQNDVDATYCKPATNETLVLNGPIAVSSPVNNLNANDLMTDDESVQESRIPVKYNLASKTGVVKKAGKAIFSPFENSPVKIRVAAFEQLKAEETTTGRITRTKTKNKAKQEDENVDQTVELIEARPKTKLKYTPIMTNRLLTSYSSSASKVMCHSSLLVSDIKLPTKASSALKSSQQEFRERELRRREKELEGIRKKEEVRQQQIEEAKRKREERHLKAQQIREEQEKIKQKHLEQRRLKEEKYKQMLAERQEKRQKKLEENERKRKEAMKKAVEGRQKEEEEKLSGKEKMSPPIYMTQKAPLLPTDQCYDSDEEQYDKGRVPLPAWQQRDKMEVALITQQCVGTKHVYTLFCCESQTPDLREIFQKIDPKKLKRTSSAIWHKAPRFTMFPVGDSFDEKDEDEQDELEEEED